MKSLKVLFVAVALLVGNWHLLAQEEVSESQIDLPVLTDVDTLVLSNNALGFDLYSHIQKRDQNLVFSPYSIATALQMVYVGAEGLTQSQMSRVLHFTLPLPALEEAATSLTKGLVSKTKRAGDDFLLNVANGMWVQQGHPILPTFETSVSSAYKGVIKSVDFKNKSEAVLSDINAWVKAQTQGKITDLLSSSAVSSATRLILISTLYMQAKWQTIFNASLTLSMPFFPYPSRTLTVPMMSSTGLYGFQKEKDFSIVELPYAVKGSNPKVAMYIVLPHEKYGLQEVEQSLNSNDLFTLIRGLKQANLTLLLPKFKVTSTIGVKELLEAMGLAEPFASSANFSGIDGTTDLQITDVLQKAFIEVDEKGTEAGAASAVSVGLKSVLTQEPPENVTVDHPFLFFVIDKLTGALLFMGRVVMP
ncbi:MAG: serpin family protein [Parachlamydiaceae bacterium]